MARQVREAGFDRRDILRPQLVARHAAMHLEGAHGGDDDRRVRLQPGLAALDVEELLGAEIGPEPGLGDDVIGQLQRGLRRDDRVAAMRDVRERPAMDKGRVVLQRLHQVRRDRVLQQHRHRARRLQLLGAHQLARPRLADDDVAEPPLQIGEIARRDRRSPSPRRRRRCRTRPRAGTRSRPRRARRRSSAAPGRSCRGRAARSRGASRCRVRCPSRCGCRPSRRAGCSRRRSRGNRR